MSWWDIKPTISEYNCMRNKIFPSYPHFWNELKAVSVWMFIMR